MGSFNIKQLKGAVEIVESQGISNLLRRGLRFYSSDPDLDIKKAIRRFSKNYEIFLDIGAAVGSVTFDVVSLFSKCVCFEPERKNFQEFKKKLVEEKVKNVEIFNFALGREKSKKQFFVSRQGRLDNRFGIEDGEEFDSYEVDIMPLDDVLFEMNLNKKCLIKIDVQGFELDVMKGAKNILEKDCTIISEFWPWAMKLNKYEPQEYVDYLNSFGYSFFDLKGKPIKKEDLEKLCHIKNKKFVHDDFVIKKE